VGSYRGIDAQVLSSTGQARFRASASGPAAGAGRARSPDAQSLRDSLASRTCPRTVNSLTRLGVHRAHKPSPPPLLPSFGFADYAGRGPGTILNAVDNGLTLRIGHLAGLIIVGRRGSAGPCKDRLRQGCRRFALRESLSCSLQRTACGTSLQGCIHGVSLQGPALARRPGPQARGTQIQDRHSFGRRELRDRQYGHRV